MKKYLLACIFFMGLFASALSVAQINQPKEIQTSQNFGEYTVHYNVFNSKTIPADIAETYHLKRGRDLAIVNIAITRAKKTVPGNSLGIPAAIKGTATNLMQQTTALKFVEIQEGPAVDLTATENATTDSEGATYYLASFRYINEEDIHFNLQVSPKNAPEKTFEISFTRKLYTEN